MTLRPLRGSAMLLLWLGLSLAAAACSFSSPKGSEGDDDGGDSSGDDDTDPMPGCLDADGDTICDTADKCAGHDDRTDVDGDEISDGCDDWLCGVKPGDPGDPMGDSGSEGRSWGASFITIGDDRRLAVTAGQPFNARFLWSLYIDCGSSQSSCQAQVEVGFGATRAGCIFDSNISEKTLISILYNGQLTAPATPGLHELRLNAGRGTSCGGGSSWYGGDPGPGSTIAVLCVR